MKPESSKSLTLTSTDTNCSSKTQVSSAAIMQMSACSTQQSALETAESASTSLQSASETVHSATASLQSGLATAESAIATSSASEVQENGVEETSMTASQVIQKFEATSKSSSEVNIMAISSVSSHLMQDTVSSRMKKISAEEYAVAERKNKQTAETTDESQKNVSETLVKKTSINKKSIAENKASSE